MYATAAAARHPDRPAIVMADSGVVLTYTEYEAGANQLAHLYRRAGLQPGDHVAFVMENNPLLLLAEAAAERTGLYYTCVNHYLAPDEAAYIVKDCQATLVVSSYAKEALARQLPDLCPLVDTWLMVDTARPPEPFIGYEEAVSGLPTTPVHDERLGAAMLYSSGTTGRPKGIARKMPDTAPSEEPAGSADQRLRWGLSDDSVYLSPAPLYHAAPQGSISLVMRAGGTAIVMESFDPRRFLDLVTKYRVTHTQLVPTMCSRLLKLPLEVRREADTSSLQTVIVSSAPFPAANKRAMIDWLGPIIMEFYAASEGIGFTFCSSQEWLTHPGTVGRPIGTAVLIRDEAGKLLPPGVPGTVWFKGPESFRYYNDPAGTAATRDDEIGASTVGDVGYLDADGYLYLTDRKSFMIISGGVNIYPQETENLLQTHPKVEDAAVIGVPDDDMGEVVKAVVQLVDGVDPDTTTAQELIDYCRAGIAHYKCPRSVDFVIELPRLPTGKLYKAQLREKYWAGHEARIG